VKFGPKEGTKLFDPMGVAIKEVKISISVLKTMTKIKVKMSSCAHGERGVKHKTIRGWRNFGVDRAAWPSLRL
jgi:hypothetical protein